MWAATLGRRPKQLPNSVGSLAEWSICDDEEGRLNVALTIGVV